MSRQDNDAHLGPIAEALNSNTHAYRVEAETMYLIPIADLHVGAIQHNEKAFDAFLDVFSRLKNAFLIIGGDSTEHAMTRLSSGSPLDQKIHGADQVLELREKLKPYKDRILFVRTGNHGYERSQRVDGMAPEKMLAALLEVPYCEGFGALVANVCSNQYVIATQHNRKAPSAFQWLQSDLTIFEHDHKSPGSSVTLVARVNPTSRTWTVREKLDVHSGSWLTWGGYAMHAGYRPNVTGAPVIELSGKTGGWNIVVHPRLDNFLELATFRKHYHPTKPPVHDEHAYRNRGRLTNTPIKSLIKLRAEDATRVAPAQDPSTQQAQGTPQVRIKRAYRKKIK